ncbi:MAG: peptidyl-prolyl cis-trans isomerase [Thermodesulfovibrionales bacterium]
MEIKSKEQRAKSKELRAKSKKFYVLSSMLCALCCLLIFWGGCASLSQKEAVLAVVDGEPVTEEDLKYALNIAHRREDLSSAGALNLSQYVQKLIDDRLIIHEARNAGMDQYPEVKQAIEAYILRESVVILHDEEIVQKVFITEEEIKDYYKRNYERFTLGIIEISLEEKAIEILEQIKNGKNFKELAQKYSTYPSKKDESEVVFTRGSLSTEIQKAVSPLKPDEVSDIIKLSEKFYIVKLMSRKEAPDEEFEKVKGSLQKAIRKQREKERSDEYLKYLREKANIKIDEKLLSAIKLDGDSEREKWSKDKRHLVEVNGAVLTVEDFMAMIKPSPKISKENILESWIDRKVIDNEALSRHYEMKPGLKKMAYRYENQLLKNTFIKRVIIPQIVVTGKNLEEYYATHQKSFIKPVRYKIQQITVKSREEAQEILDSLQKGADFLWLAKRKSADSATEKGGDAGLFTKAELPKPLGEIIDSMKAGDTSPIIEIESLYKIFRIQDITGEVIEEYAKVKNNVHKAYVNEQVNTTLNRYIDKLKKDAEIKINEEEIRAIEKKFKQ